LVGRIVYSVALAAAAIVPLITMETAKFCPKNNTRSTKAQPLTDFLASACDNHGCLVLAQVPEFLN
jgi:hypothetical protein